MANNNFVVKNGLTVGNLEVTATTGNLTTSGNINTVAVYTGALQVTGDAGIGGNLYVGANVFSLGGQPLRNIQVTIDTVPPMSSEIGDVWYDSESGASYQFISDGTSTFWIQFGASF